MDFIEELNQLSQRINERKNHVTNEETTKQALIIPFIQLLGYDVFNPLEVRPEYVSDFARKKGEKVDYAIFNNNEAVMFIEAKSVSENLEKHSAQIARYFNATHTMKLAVLTNGIEYQLYTDLNVINVMDETPFIRFNVLSPSDDSLKVLEQIRKANYSQRAVQELAEELMYAKDIELFLKKQLTEPSNEFIRFVVKDISSTRITATVIEKFRPLVKKSLAKTIHLLSNEPDRAESADEPASIERPKKPFAKKNPHKAAACASAAVENTLTTEVGQGPSTVTESILTTPVKYEEVSEPSEFLCGIFQNVKKIAELENFDTAGLTFKNTKDEMLIYMNSEENWLAKLKTVDDKYQIVLPFSYDVIAGKLGSVFTYQDTMSDETPVDISEPEDVYRMSRLFIRRLNNVIVEV